MLFVKLEVLWSNLWHIFIRLRIAERFLLIGWLVILALMPFHAFLSTWGGSSIGPLEAWKAWKEILLAICLLVSVGYLKQRQLLGHFFQDNLVRLCVAYAGLHILLWALLRPDTSAAMAGILMNLRFLGMFLLTMVILCFMPYKQILRVGLVTVFIGAALTILFGLLQSIILPDDFLRHFGYGAQTIAPVTTLDDNQYIPRIQSTLRGPNPFGAYLMLIIPLFLVLWQRGRELFMAGWLMIAALLLFSTHSRSAWLGMVAALVVFAALRFKNVRLRQRVIGFIGIAGLVGALLVALLLPRSSFLQTTILHNKTTDTDRGSTSEHFYAAERSVTRIGHEPLGQGPGAAGPASFYGSVPQIPENYYLQITEELGVIGISMFIAINTLVVQRLWKKRRNLWAAALLAGFAGMIVVNLFQQGWADETTAIVWWTLAALVLGGSQYMDATNTSAVRRRTS